jgi:hypothetical protein
MKMILADTSKISQVTWFAYSVTSQVPDKRKRPQLEDNMLPGQGYHTLEGSMIDEQRTVEK